MVESKNVKTCGKDAMMEHNFKRGDRHGPVAGDEVAAAALRSLP